jgi:TRAP-type transport system periplasmic protein
MTSWDSIDGSINKYLKNIKFGGTNKMKKSMSLFLVLALSTGLFGCSSSKGTSTAPASESKKITIKLSHGLSTEHPYQLGTVKFAELVKTYSKDTIEVKVFPSAQLGNERDNLEGLKMGTLDMALTGTGVTQNFQKKLAVFGLPYLFRDAEHAYKVLDGPIGEELFGSLDQNGIKYLAAFENGFRMVTNNKKEIKEPADLKGMKIRTPESEVSLSTLKAMGAESFPMAWGEVVTALKQGVMDGQENALVHIWANKTYEAQKYISLTAHQYDPAPLMMSKILWDKLSKDQQDAVLKAAREARDFERKTFQDMSKDAISKFKANGNIVTENPNIAAFREAVKPVWEKFEPTVGKDLIDKIVNTK